MTLDDLHESEIYLLYNILNCSVTYPFTTTTSFSAFCLQALFSQYIMRITSVWYKTVCNYSHRNHSCYTLNYLMLRKNEQNINECHNGHHISMKQNHHQWFICDFDKGTELQSLNLYEIRPHLFLLYKTLRVHHSPSVFKPHTSKHLYT
jgi:hypothetical protein